MKFSILFKRFPCAALFIMLFAGLAAITGCGPSGVFWDSPVAGLTYQTSFRNQTVTTQTTEDGVFYYKKDESITFSVGSLVLGSAVGKSVITPLDIVSGATNSSDQRVVNICVLLQTLDQDGNLNNGIQITPAIAAIASSAGTINFDQTTSAFAADPNVTGLLSALNTASPAVFTDADPRPRKLRSATDALQHFVRSTGERKIVMTKYGVLKGFAANATTWQFIGIPYAKPPIGDLRWKPPQAPTAWTGVHDAIAFGAQSPQNPANEAFGAGGMSEDCLYLNITAPKNAEHLPVMVWFHGGGFTSYSGNQLDHNNPTGLSTKGVILVTLTHRLGPFGYLGHPLLTAESGINSSGNYGQLDLIAALTWVKHNIASFGGDPKNVTIFGQSGGGAKVQFSMISPLAKGLFHKAICLSGTMLSTNKTLNGMPLATAEAQGTSLFARLGVTTLAEARTKTWTEIIAAGMPTDGYGPVVDAYYITKNMGDSIKGGMVSDVPFIAGAVSGDLGGLIPGLIEQMPWRSSNNTANQYVYKFNKMPSGWEARGIKPGHTCDLSYVFNYPGTMAYYYLLGYVIDPATGKKPVIGDLNGNGIPAGWGDMVDIMIDSGWNAVDVNTTDTTMTMLTNFAKTGNPSIDGFIWPAYTTANDTYIDIDATLTVKTGLATGW